VELRRCEPSDHLEFFSVMKAGQGYAGASMMPSSRDWESSSHMCSGGAAAWVQAWWSMRRESGGEKLSKGGIASRVIGPIRKHKGQASLCLSIPGTDQLPASWWPARWTFGTLTFSEPAFFRRVGTLQRRSHLNLPGE